MIVVLQSGYAEKGVALSSCVIDDGVAYLEFSEFHLYFYLNKDEDFFPSAPQSVRALNQTVVDTWNNWFSMIQEMKKNGTLKGVIIDLRGNTGGLVPDFRYVIGALIPQDSSLQIGYHREKNGVGRYDYGPLLPDVRPSLSDPHETITEPIVVLTNCLSESMSEVTAMSAKTLSNGRVVGKRSFGALGGLIGGPESYSYTYAGCIGEEDKTPVYVYLPICASFSMDKKSYEGVGVEPDIEVDFDKDLFTATGRDTQLERALQYIETGD
jgi:carboxyl-terminal processing protease